MTVTRQSTICLCWLVSLLFMCNAVALAQTVVPPIPISVTPIGMTRVSVQPGGRYTFEVPRLATSSLRPIDLISSAPGVTIAPLPNGPDGTIRRKVQVSADAPLGETAVQVVTDQGEKDVEVIVVPPHPPGESGVEGDRGEGDSTGTVADKSKDRHSGSRWGWLAVFGVGVVVGLVVRRRS